MPPTVWHSGTKSLGKQDTFAGKPAGLAAAPAPISFGLGPLDRTIWATDINHPGSDNLCCRTARTPTIEEGLVSLSFHQSQAIATILGATATAIPNTIACQIVIYDSPSCLFFYLRPEREHLQAKI